MPELTEKLARVESTWLGTEDHGIFTAVLQLDYGTAQQGAGSYDLRHSDAAALRQMPLQAAAWAGHVHGHEPLPRPVGVGPVVGLAGVPAPADRHHEPNVRSENVVGQR